MVNSSCCGHFLTSLQGGGDCLTIDGLNITSPILLSKAQFRKKSRTKANYTEGLGNLQLFPQYIISHLSICTS